VPRNINTIEHSDGEGGTCVPANKKRVGKVYAEVGFRTKIEKLQVKTSTKSIPWDTSSDETKRNRRTEELLFPKAGGPPGEGGVTKVKRGRKKLIGLKIGRVLHLVERGKRLGDWEGSQQPGPRKRKPFVLVQAVTPHTWGSPHIKKLRRVACPLSGGRERGRSY